ncbi:MAG: hypothetical protein EHM81_02240 [Chloroflexi bacterium]|nr:MAG: hypothetical protein EHM81_13140 [Chloroflexota bacterium]RPH62446.1 MAG: hypothetical protein EHM81_02240 [Chloroflexota bacterium]
MEDLRETGTMKEFGHEHELGFRKDVLEPLFRSMMSAESCFLVGAGSIGKTRIIDHMIRTDVRGYYLGANFGQTLIIRLDMNRLSEYTEWEFYELMLFNIIQTIGQSENKELDKLSSEIMLKFLMPILDSPEKPTKALRFLELAITKILMADEKLFLCFLLDEFDDAYPKLPAKLFAHLRGIRDTNKNRLCYALFLRNLPRVVRPAKDHEGFYELFSRTMIKIGPYSKDDSISMLKQLESRKNIPVQLPVTFDKIYFAAGGHPGMMQAIFGFLAYMSETDPNLVDVNWLVEQDNVKEECQKLFDSLETLEKDALVTFAKDRTRPGREAASSLIAKGLVKLQDRNLIIFSPVFEQFLRNQ